MQPEPQHEDVVTIMFTDVEGSTGLTTLHGDEAARRLIDLQRAVIREQVEGAGGTVRDVIGDGFRITFPSTRRAVSCALDIQRRLADHAQGQPGEVVRVRIGLHVGEVLQEDSGHPVGAAVNAAARVAANARGGQVLVSDTVRQLAGRLPGVAFRDRGRFERKGFPERWRLHEAVAEDAPSRRRLRLPARSPSRGVLASAAGLLLAAFVRGAHDAERLLRDGRRPPGRRANRAADRAGRDEERRARLRLARTLRLPRRRRRVQLLGAPRVRSRRADEELVDEVPRELGLCR